jgi:hypothetical protein
MTGITRWKRADTPEKLLALATYAEQNGAHDAGDTAYSEAKRLAPQNRAACSGRIRVALTSGHTAEAQRVAEEIVQRGPDDARRAKEQSQGSRHSETVELVSSSNARAGALTPRPQ